MTPLLGCIADDFTGATDLAGMLVKAGMRTVQMIGTPTAGAPRDVDAIVIALKSRTAPVEQAVQSSLAALKWLQRAGCRQFYFKYCSTFDSTDHGNIGPVADALMAALDTRFTIACPAFPENRRTIYKGHLFVGDVPLAESGMRDHPLTPMTDSNLVRVLQRQTRRNVGLIDYDVVRHGADAIRERMKSLEATGVEIAIADALTNDDLMAIGKACAALPLVTAASGIALGLPQNFRSSGALNAVATASALPRTDGLRAVISGSCSHATQAQVKRAVAAGVPSFAVDPLRLAAGENVARAALDWAQPRIVRGPVLIYATANADEVKQVQTRLGTERAGALVEQALSAVALGLVQAGVRQLIVAGGETSGAVVNALGIKGLRIGPEIDPGVPWTCSLDEPPLALALKSGNFGGPDFFIKAWRAIAGDAA
ncbi:MAG: 3-oxo-tetronate kinase [Rhodospirillaceae bacterium]